MSDRFLRPLLVLAGAASLAALAACPEPTTTADDDDDQYDLSASLVAFYPEDGSIDVSVGECAWAQFDRAPDNVAFEIVGDGGSPVAGDIETEDGLLVQFCPRPAYRFGTSYQVDLSWDEEDTAQWSFETQGGDPVGVQSGDQFLIDAREIQIIEPAVLNLLADQFLGDADVQAIIELDDSDGLMDVFGGAVELDPETEELFQDPCFPTIRIGDYTDVRAFQDPYFQAGPDDVLFSFQGFDLQLIDLTLQGFFPDRDSIELTSVATRVDTRSIFDGACDLVGQFGVTCVECADGEVACIDVEVAFPEGERLDPPFPLEERSEEEIANDPRCEEEEEEPKEPPPPSP